MGARFFFLMVLLWGGSAVEPRAEDRTQAVDQALDMFENSVAPPIMEEGLVPEMNAALPAAVEAPVLAEPVPSPLPAEEPPPAEPADQTQPSAEPSFAPRALLRGQIIRVHLNTAHPKGLDWPAILSDHQAIAPSDPAGHAVSVGVIPGEDFPILMDALNQAGDVTVVSRPVTEESSQAPVVWPIPLNAGGTELSLVLRTEMPEQGEMEIAVSVGAPVDGRVVTVRMREGQALVIGGILDAASVLSPAEPSSGKLDPWHWLSRPAEAPPADEIAVFVLPRRIPVPGPSPAGTE